MLVSLLFLSKSLSTHQDNSHEHSVMLQWNTHFTVRDKAATCPCALLSFPAHWSTDYSWPLLCLEPTGGKHPHFPHRGKHHLGESFLPCKSAVIATRMEAALHWMLSVSAVWLQRLSSGVQSNHHRCVQLIGFPKFCTARESCTIVSFIVEIMTCKGYSVADSLDFSG